MAAALQVHGPKRHLLAGNLPEFRRDRLGFLMTCAREHGDVVPLRFGVFRAVFVNDPALIEDVLRNSRSFVKSFAYRMVRPVVGNGLLLSEGDVWIRQRRLAQPAFQRARMGEAYTPAIVRCTQRLMDRWSPGEVRDVHTEMMRVTAEIAGEAFFGANVSERVDEVSRMLLVLGELLTNRLDSVLSLLPSGLPTPTNVRVRQTTKNLDAVIYPIIEHRRRNGTVHDDLLSRLLAAQDEDGSQMTDLQLRDEVMTFFLAGHETTSLLLSWTLFLLSRHPAMQERLQAEVAAVLDGEPPAFVDLGKLPFLDAVLCETLRLYPPVWAMGREPLEDCELGGHRVAKGTGILPRPIAPLSGCVVSCALLLAQSQDAQVEEDKADQDRGHDERERSPLAQVQEVEGGGVRVPGKERRRRTGPASGQDVDQVKDRDRHHGLVDQDDQQRPAQQRQGDEAKPLPGGRAIHRGRVDHLGRDHLQAGKKEDGRQREFAPHVRHDDRPHGQLSIGEPRDVVMDEPDLQEEAVEGAEIAVQQ